MVSKGGGVNTEHTNPLEEGGVTSWNIMLEQEAGQKRRNQKDEGKRASKTQQCWRNAKKS